MNYRIFFVLALFVFFVPQHILAATEGEMHVVITGATEDFTLNKEGDCQIVVRSIAAVRKIMRQIGQEMNLDVVIHEVSGMDFRANEIKQTLSKVAGLSHPGRGKKFMLIYYSLSHGTNVLQTPSKFPFILCNPTDKTYKNDPNTLLSTEGIFEELLQKSQFDHVHVWAELCNELLPSSAKVPQKTVRLSPFGQTMAYNNLKSLLYSVKGSLITSSEYGDVSVASKGMLGAFSGALFKTIQGVMDGTITANFEGSGAFLDVLNQKTLKRSTLMGAPHQPMYRLEKSPVLSRHQQPQTGNGLTDVIKGVHPNVDFAPTPNASPNFDSQSGVRFDY